MYRPRPEAYAAYTVSEIISAKVHAKLHRGLFPYPTHIPPHNSVTMIRVRVGFRVQPRHPKYAVICRIPL